MNTQHTPGPWAVDTSDWPLIVNSDADDSVIATLPLPQVFGQGSDVDAERLEYGAMANARLIAAAPELVQELRSHLDWLASYPGEGANAVYDRTRALLIRVLGHAV